MKKVLRCRKLKMADCLKRSFDVAASIILLVGLSPMITIGLLASGFILKRTPRVGLNLSIFDEFSFPSENDRDTWLVRKLHISRLPVLFNVVYGNISFVGPLPKSPGDPSLTDEELRARSVVRPGMISLWWIRRRANIDYETEFFADMQYIEKHGFWTDIAICLRAIPAIFYGDKVSIISDKVALFGLTINNITMSEALDTIIEWLGNQTAKHVCFVNADCVNIAYKNEQYRKILKGADLCLADGIGLKLAGKFLGQEIAQNLCGTDMFPRICERLSGSHFKVFLLGARPEAVEGVVQWIADNHPQVVVAGYHHGYFLPEEESSVVNKIRESGAQLLLVAFGVPKQDIWINQRLNETGMSVAMGVGGLFDFYSGRIPRAPLWIREIGMEWVYRLIQEPRRMWKRYLIGNLVFLWRVFKERLSARYV